MVTKGSEYEYWQEGVLNEHENVHRCFAFKGYSRDFVKMAQGFGSDCNGMSNELNFDSAFRLTKSSSLHDLQGTKKELLPGSRGGGSGCAGCAFAHPLFRALVIKVLLLRTQFLDLML